MSKGVVVTNYRAAWIAFRKSPEFKSCADAMKVKGIKQRYASNMLQTAFAAGWGKRKIVIINK